MVKINFVWSFVYQESIHSKNVKSEIYDLESYKKYVLDFIKEVKVLWEKVESDVLEYIEKISMLKWKKKEIDCYVIKISNFGPISIPLTIPIHLETERGVSTLTHERFIDFLVHELIHNIFSQNEKKTDKYFDYLILEKYKNESFNTAIHVPVHAIHKKIFLKYFNKERLDNEIKMSGYYPDYKKAWDIVNKRGEDLIIKFVLSTFSFLVL